MHSSRKHFVPLPLHSRPSNSSTRPAYALDHRFIYVTNISTFQLPNSITILVLIRPEVTWGHNQTMGCGVTRLLSYIPWTLPL